MRFQKRCPHCGTDATPETSAWGFIRHDLSNDDDDDKRVFLCPCDQAVWIDDRGWYVTESYMRCRGT